MKHSSKINKSYLVNCLIISIPVLLFLIGHGVGAYNSPDRYATWFFNGESPYYMANARQYADHGFQSLFYGNPFSYLKDPQNIYFQFQTITAGLVFYLTKIDPGVIWMVLGLVVSYLYIFYAQVFFGQIGLGRKGLLFITFLYFWGAGLHSLFGFFHEKLILGGSLVDSIKAFEKFDIAEGWWMHSVGRNFIMPNYIYYHFLVMLSFIFISSKRYTKLYVTLFVLSFSHPFVGLQLIISVCIWTLYESLYLKKVTLKEIKPYAPILLLGLHLGYYMIFLRTSSEHVLQEAQWHTSITKLYENWAFLAKNFIPSYAIVWAIFFYTIRTPKHFFNLFSSPINRFLGVFGVTNFLLANNEFAINPIQPIHFTHGMVWIPFFLLGRDTLIDIYHFLSRKKYGVVLVFIIAFLYSFDNFTWMAKKGIQTFRGESQAELNLKTKEYEVINFLNKNLKKSILTFPATNSLAYQICVYTPHRAFASHVSITPEFSKRKNIQDEVVRTGEVPIEYMENEIAIISRNKIPNFKEVFSNEKYFIYLKRK